MSSTVVAKNLQVGADGTASNNFTIYQPASPDGTLRIGNGNTGTTSAQVVLTSAGNVGIGTSSPAVPLEVSRSGDSQIRVRSVTAGIDARLLTTGDAGVTGTWSNHGFVLRTNDIERMRINAGAPILCLAGGNTSATGTGIAFPATQSASSDANTLDDYEEGTFTPTWNGGTVTVNQCNYTKIGRLVHAMYDIQLGSSASSSTSFISVPFPINPSVFYTGVFNFNSVSASHSINLDAGAVYIRAAVNSSNIAGSALSGARLIFSVTYYA